MSPAKHNPKNPDNNSIIQALQDVMDYGFGELTIRHLLDKLSNDRKLRNAMQDKWNSHAYPERSLTFSKLAIEPRLNMVSDSALRILITLGSLAAKSGLVRIRKQDLATITRIASKTTMQTALRELVECGMIAIKVPAAGHKPPIYEINPAIMSKRMRLPGDESDFVESLTMCKRYYRDEPLNYVIQQDTIRAELMENGDTLYYTYIHLVPPDTEDKNGQPQQTTTSNQKLPELTVDNDDTTFLEFMQRESSANTSETPAFHADITITDEEDDDERYRLE